ncbi:proteasome assembly chaperone 4 [Lingula anatina]|uniref:Proteasome assembly chaperone 4 n=1 Tax=Lingula anatina TaxID=7574 RepID=A0A1S3JGG1_LINAN|nr:proteasome assembly chaperone 4 [Lingula anatina]|eukprot:XP_013409231.1 proteasome assembly chaperone 4 [Lingula anatina]
MTAEILPSESLLSVYNFSGRLKETDVNFHVLKLHDSFMLWIGTEPAKMDDLSMAMPTRFDSMPLGTQVLGESTDLTSTSLAQKLAKKTGKQVFVSFNMAADSELVLRVEERVMEEMMMNPDKF